MMFRRLFTANLTLAATLAAIVLPSGSAVAQACLSAQEAKAEHAIRLHTELMVFSLTCTDFNKPGAPTLYARYREFNDRHQVAVRDWEGAMMAALRKDKKAKASATKQFDSFRTSLANEASRRAIALTTPVYCANHVAAVDRILAMSKADLAKLLDEPAAVRVAALPRCEAKPAPKVAGAASALDGVSMAQASR